MTTGTAAPAPLGQGFREAAVTAFYDGHTAAKASHPPTVCPYPAGSALARVWVRGYTRGSMRRPSDLADEQPEPATAGT